jgi:hypothetical protein
VLTRLSQAKERDVHLEETVFVTEDELSEELRATRRLLSGSSRDPDETCRVNDRYCNAKEAKQADEASKDGHVVGGRKGNEEVAL